MKRTLRPRITFVILAFIGSPAVAAASWWGLAGLGLDVASFTVSLLFAITLGPSLIFVMGLGKAIRRTANEVLVVAFASLGATALVGTLLTAWALGRAELN